MNDEFERESSTPREITSDAQYRMELEDRLRRIYDDMERHKYWMTKQNQARYYDDNYRAYRQQKIKIQDLIYYAVTGNEPEERIPF